MPDGPRIDGERSKRFRIYRADIDRKPHEFIEEFDTPEEVHNRRRRLDRVELIKVGGEYLTYVQFTERFPKAEGA